MPRRFPVSPVLLASLALPLAALAACSDNKGTAATQQQLGPAASRDYPLTGFDRIELQGADSVVVHSGPAFAIRAEAPQGVLDRLELTVDNGLLKIGRRDNDWTWGGEDAEAKISVTLPALNGVALTGSGDMDVERAGGGRPFQARLTGSEDLDIARLEAPEASLGVAGSGDLKVRGRIGRGEYSVAGSGNLEADGLEADTIRASVAGSGDIGARAKGEASISVIGSGDVTVGGGARCSVTRIGTGEAKCV